MSTGEHPDFPAPEAGFVATLFLVVDNVERSRTFYTTVFDAEVIWPGDEEGWPAFLKLSNTWLVINTAGGPTEDKPTVHCVTPEQPDRVSAFMNLRVADVQECYENWCQRGAEFLTPPQDRGYEIRCYMRDPDGHLIEVGQHVPQEQSSDQDT